MAYILNHNTIQTEDLVGGKAKALAKLSQYNLPIPEWLVITPNAFYDSLGPDQKGALSHVQSHTDALDVFKNLTLSTEVKLALENAITTICPKGELLAVRSSALEEDSQAYSFAGQLQSFLFVSPQDAIERVCDVWRSAFSQQVLNYRKIQNLPLIPQAPAVILQRMIQSETSGVAFTIDPVTGNTEVSVISAVYGLGTSLVNGQSNADVFYINPHGKITKTHLAHKETADVYNPEQPNRIGKMSVPETHRKISCLQDFEIQAILKLSHSTTQIFGYPQDVEWCIANRQLYLLQSRPVTTLGSHKPGISRIWNNVELEEYWSDVTTPLTYSVVCRFYELLYKQFCMLMRIHPQKLVEQNDTFRQLVGLIQGRIYFNVSNFQHIWSFVPYFTEFQNIIESLFHKTLTDEGEEAPSSSPVHWKQQLTENVFLLKSIGLQLYHYLLLPNAIKNLQSDSEKIFSDLEHLELHRLSPDKLAVLYHQLEKTLFPHWAICHLNNIDAYFFQMLFSKALNAWCGEEAETLQNELLCGNDSKPDGDLIQNLETLAATLTKTPDMIPIFCERSLNEIQSVIEELPEFKTAYDTFLAKFGNHSFGDLKLENPMLLENPLPLFQTIGKIANRKKTMENTHPPATIRINAEKVLQETLASHKFKYIILRWILKNTRARYQARQNIHFRLCSLYGWLRQILITIGFQFQKSHLLSDAKDIFYLSIEEILGYIEGTATTTSLSHLVALRKEEFKKYTEAPAPPNEFETIGTVYQSALQTTVSQDNGPPDNKIQGTGCSPGIVRGKIRFIHNHSSQINFSTGEILVAEHCDPGMIMLYPAVSGLLFERGSMLSHAAIISRELGIPTIVSIPGITHWLQEGDWIEMDGTTGWIKKLTF